MAAAAFTTRLKSSGSINPSLILSNGGIGAGGQPHDGDVKFLERLVAGGLVDPESGIMLRNDGIVSNDFDEALKLATNDSVAQIADVQLRQKTLVQRRAILLAIVGATAADNLALKAILNKGFLFNVKSWLDDILTHGTGGVDLLLHLLGNIACLPVTKEMVTSSKLGRQVAAVEKHKICEGMNEAAIKKRVASVKELWSASVKRMKKANGTNTVTQSGSNLMKRSIENDSTHANKRAKTNSNPPKKSSLSSYLQQVSSSNDPPAAEPVPKKADKKPVEKNTDVRYSQVEVQIPAHITEPVGTKVNESNLQKDEGKKNVKWADTEGGPLYITHQARRIAYDDDAGEDHDMEKSWKDRKKRDRLREKELLQKARKSKLVDQNDSLDTMAMMFSSGWHQPLQLSPDTENPPVQVNSDELNAQMRRVLSSLPVSYLSEEDVPRNPTPLSEVEQTLDMASQASSIPQKIPLFAGQPEPAPVSTPAQAPIPFAIQAPPLPTAFAPPPSTPTSMATAEVVQSLGLPPFLIGQNTQALQTLASSPGLLSAFVDVSGNYDQIKIINLVQTLTTNITGASTPAPSLSIPPPPPPQPFSANVPSYGASVPTFGQQYGTSQASQYQTPPPQASIYGTNQQQTNKSTYRDQSSTEGNLHLSGFGPMTTPDSIVALFAPYVKVDEVVPKNGFMFLNTSDPEGAKRAREALNGVMVGGGPLRINAAVRRNKNHQSESSSSGRTQPPSTTTPLPRNALGQIDYDSVRDDRGNAATRNLFVAGYGPSTTEKDLRDCFGQHCQVTGIVMKGTFSFINTAEKNAAVDSRHALTGSQLNGGSLRINFAKETGRLGTTFDGGQPVQKHRNHVPQMNYYGRSY